MPVRSRTVLVSVVLGLGASVWTIAAVDFAQIRSDFQPGDTVSAADFNVLFDAIGDNFAMAEAVISDLEERLASLEAENATLKLQLEELASLLAGVTRPDGDTILFDGVNVQLVNGEGDTETSNGLGNLIIGYNEPPPNVTAGDRGGSHYLVVGAQHRFSSYGGMVVGWRNSATARWASVSGGFSNTASGPGAAVSGGSNNLASEGSASVTGGLNNTASGPGAAVSGGTNNTAGGGLAAVSGGEGNTAAGSWSSVTGGENNVANAAHSAVSGGKENTAQGAAASVSGGEANVAGNTAASVTGGLRNRAGRWASVSGGVDNIARQDYSSISGGSRNDVRGVASSILGGHDIVLEGHNATHPD